MGTLGAGRSFRWRRISPFHHNRRFDRQPSHPHSSRRRGNPLVWHVRGGEPLRSHPPPKAPGPVFLNVTNSESSSCEHAGRAHLLQTPMALWVLATTGLFRYENGDFHRCELPAELSTRVRWRWTQGPLWLGSEQTVFGAAMGPVFVNRIRRPVGQ